MVPSHTHTHTHTPHTHTLTESSQLQLDDNDEKVRAIPEKRCVLILREIPKNTPKEVSLSAQVFLLRHFWWSCTTTVCVCVCVCGEAVKVIS